MFIYLTCPPSLSFSFVSFCSLLYRALSNNRDVFLNILLLVLLRNVMKLFNSFIWLVIIHLFPKNEALSNVKGLYLCLSELVTGQNITGVESLILMKPNV